MDIRLPERLSYYSMPRLPLSEAAGLEGGSDTINFDWTRTVWAALPEISAVLCHSSRLVHLGYRVTWILPDPRIPLKNREDLVFDAVVGKDVLRRLNEIRAEALSNTGITSDRRNWKFQTFLKSFPRISPQIEAWVTAESNALQGLDLLGYFNRYKILDCAAVAGIQLSPHPSSLPRALFDRKSDTPCLEFSPIHSLTDVDAIVARLCDPKELERILGEYSTLDVAHRGSLSQVLVAELGKNVGEHSDASAAWLCTRLVHDDNLKSHCSGDPMLQQFLQSGSGFLEIMVLDNGRGLTSGLHDVLARDPRGTVKTKYTTKDGKYDEADLVDYAFDRLSSTKRDIATLVHLSHGDAASVVASGLYWIWNVIRTHRGILGVRTGSVFGWYDFTAQSGTLSPWDLPPLVCQRRPAFFPGTMVRICLPLRDIAHANTDDLVSPSSTAARSQVEGREIHMSWVGDITRRSSLRRTRGWSKAIQPLLPGFGDLAFPSILEELRHRHCVLKDGDLLLLDLAGTRRLWATRTVAQLCNFFLEMNFTSTTGRSTVVLWNLPHSDESLFEQAIAEATMRNEQIGSFRRIALLVRDDGYARFVCGWKDAERILDGLLVEGEDDLDNLGASRLSSPDRRRLAELISENSHLFSWTGRNRAKLLAWPMELKAFAWQHESQWLDEIIDKNAHDDGAQFVHPNNGFYRLPTTGHLVRNFYSFGGMISNQRSSARIAWLLSHVLSGIERLHGRPDYLVSVTHPMTSMARHIHETYHLGERGIAFLPGSTIEELQRRSRKLNAGRAILITDVVSSGTLCEQIFNVLPKLQWLGTVAILDTGTSADLGRGYPKLVRDPTNPWIDFRVTRGVKTGDVYALCSRSVDKVVPCGQLQGPVTAIDRINVCPISPPNLTSDFGEPLWPYMERGAHALKVGHYHAGGLHHYVYYVNGESLIGCLDPRHDKSLLDTIVDSVVADMEAGEYDSARTVIVHPPRETSYGEEIAIAVQRATGALYRYVLHRETLDGQQRFSSFVDHGIRLKDATVIVIDDGSNTGETLMGLLQAVSAAAPARVIAHVALSRMPLFKLDLFRRLRQLNGIIRPIFVRFALRLNIPVFTPRSCPICRYRQALSTLIDHSALLSRYARQIHDDTCSVASGKNLESTESSFHWVCRSPLSAARIREAIELSDHVESSNEELAGVLQAICGLIETNGNDHGIASLIDFAFVINTEPELLWRPVFVSHLLSLFNAAVTTVERLHSGSEALTVLELAVHLALQLGTRQQMGFQQSATEIWQHVLPCNLVTMPVVGTLFAGSLAHARSDVKWEKAPAREMCFALAAAFSVALSNTNRPTHDVNGAMGRLFAREVVAVLKGNFDMFFHDGVGPQSVFDLATSAAGKFWWHASRHVTRLVDAIDPCSLSLPQLSEHLYSLVLCFDELYQLQYGISQLGTPDINVGWDSPTLRHAVSVFGDALAGMAELVAGEDSTTQALRSASQALSAAWPPLLERLQPAFDGTFPSVLQLVDSMWSQCETIAELPTQAIDPYDSGTLTEYDRCFLPATLLERFLKVAIENLRDRAFPSWTKAQVATEAKVRLVVSVTETDSCLAYASIRILDNGALHRAPVITADEHVGHGEGLSDIRALAKPFEATLVGPEEEGIWTRVELSVRLAIRKAKRQ